MYSRLKERPLSSALRYRIARSEYWTKVEWRRISSRGIQVIFWREKPRRCRVLRHWVCRSCESLSSHSLRVLQEHSRSSRRVKEKIPRQASTIYHTLSGMPVGISGYQSAGEVQTDRRSCPSSPPPVPSLRVTYLEYSPTSASQVSVSFRQIPYSLNPQSRI
jgi:hypothetical protein